MAVSFEQDGCDVALSEAICLPCPFAVARPPRNSACECGKRCSSRLLVGARKAGVYPMSGVEKSGEGLEGRISRSSQRSGEESKVPSQEDD